MCGRVGRRRINLKARSEMSVAFCASGRSENHVAQPPPAVQMLIKDRGSQVPSPAHEKTLGFVAQALLPNVTYLTTGLVVVGTAKGSF